MTPKARLQPGKARSISSLCSVKASRDGAAVARRAHNPKVGGSNPSPATKSESRGASNGAPLVVLQ